MVLGLPRTLIRMRMSHSERLPFRVEASCPATAARAGSLTTLHGTVQTPVFMPVGTQATVKAQTAETLEAAGSSILLANTYHLLLRPGPEVFQAVGGIHNFTTWPGSFLTDSGGFQIFSLPGARTIREEGAAFRSYLDGRTILLSPEVSIATQKAIGSDIMMVLDQCIESTAAERAVRDAMGITHRWAARSLAARGDSPQALFAIVQGALSTALRAESASALVGMPFDGFAIGGLAVGEEREAREEICAFTARLLPENRPRYLMGVGMPVDILEAVRCGVDMFDCIIPTQVAQRGGAFTSRGFLQMRRGIHKFSLEPLDPECPCPTCRRYNRAYLHHLTKTGETFGWHLIGQHNIYFYHRLMRNMRNAIIDGSFEDFYRQTKPVLEADDLDNPALKPKISRKKRYPKTLGKYEVHTAIEGFSSIRHIESGEIMHSRIPPEEESRRLYIDQSFLEERLPKHSVSQPLVIWDVGLGAASNAMAALRCAEAALAQGQATALHIVSFENDLDPLDLALRNGSNFPYLFHSAPPSILKAGHWSSPNQSIKWDLVRGDFPNTLSASLPRPDIIFYDMFSGKSCPEAWTSKTFVALRDACGSGPSELFTYTCSTASRSAMLAAGFHVAKGRATGAKEETTVAFTPAAAAVGFVTRHPLLGNDWLARWHRSRAQTPSDINSEDEALFRERITKHPQFISKPVS